MTRDSQVDTQRRPHAVDVVGDDAARTTADTRADWLARCFGWLGRFGSYRANGEEIAFEVPAWRGPPTLVPLADDVLAAWLRAFGERGFWSHPPPQELEPALRIEARPLGGIHSGQTFQGLSRSVAFRAHAVLDVLFTDPAPTRHEWHAVFGRFGLRRLTQAPDIFASMLLGEPDLGHELAPASSMSVQDARSAADRLALAASYAIVDGSRGLQISDRALLVAADLARMDAGDRFTWGVAGTPFWPELRARLHPPVAAYEGHRLRMAFVRADVFGVSMQNELLVAFTQHELALDRQRSCLSGRIRVLAVEPCRPPPRPVR